MVIEKLASSLGRRDEVPNQELAKQIVAKNDKSAVKELIANLSNKKDIQNDCIKVLYEIGERKPSLISGYVKDFIGLLESKNNRLQWGGMSALSAITPGDPKTIYSALPKIISAANKGSVITRDKAVEILIRLYATKKYPGVFALLNEQLLNSPVNQLAMYAENAMPEITEKDRPIFTKTLTNRLNEVERETMRKRIEKVIGKLNNPA